MRFTVNHVLDMIERRLTTDVALAQAVIDVEEIVRYVELDDGRSINLVRLGMAIDALGRYLVDAAPVLYPVARRSLLSESEFTSKERMVLSRWADDGVIEVVQDVGDRVAEVADLTGLLAITVRGLRQYSSQYPWLADHPERVLRLRPRHGAAGLAPDTDEVLSDSPAVVVGKASVAAGQPEDPLRAEDGSTHCGEVLNGEEDPPTEPGTPENGEVLADSDTGVDLPKAVTAFLSRGAMSTTRITRGRLVARSDPSGLGQALLSHVWRCQDPECPAFGQLRTRGQPAPRVVGGVASCPRHGTALTEVGTSLLTYAMAVVVDDLPRLRFTVADGRPVVVGREPASDDDVSLSDWLHAEAARWVSTEHVRLSVQDGQLMVADISANGTRVWRRADGDDPGEAVQIAGTESRLGDWDSVELYTGIELIVVDHRPVTAHWGSMADRLGELASVLVDAPTVALRRPEPA